MELRGSHLTNALLGVVIVLSVLDLALPDRPGAPPRENEEGIVVRIPAEEAKRLGLSAGEIEEVISKLADDDAGARVRRARVGANELAAIATLRNLVAAQAQFQALGIADTDRDGNGEYGSFRELSGDAPVRGSTTPINPPVLSGAFRNPDDRGVVSRDGYLFAIYLPDDRGRGVVADGDPADRFSSRLAEKTWCAYAWPAEPGKTGKRTFFTNQVGDILATDAREYAGDRPPPADAAFRTGDPGRITGESAPGVEGRDGHLWRPVN